MERFFQTLKEEITGEVHHDPLHCSIYSVDASIYEVTPLGVVLPKNQQDLLKALEIAAEFQIPVTARGAATGITGACLGPGIIIDTSKYLNKILEINIEKEYAVCEPGVVQDRLNEALAPYGYRLGPDTSTGNRATIGGMLANNSAGARSLIYGCMADHVAEVEMALSGGEIVTFSAVSEEEWTRKMAQQNREGHIYREIFQILKKYRTAIVEHFPQIPRHVSGYNLDKLLKAPPLNLSQLIAGSEGTLGVALKIKMNIAKKPRFTGICILHFQEMLAPMHFIKEMLAHHPIALEMIDDKILNAARLSPNVKHRLNWLKENPQAVFIAEFEAENLQFLEEKLQKFSKEMHSLSIGYAHVILTDPQQINAVWEVRKAGLGLLLSKIGYSRAIAFIEDISVAPEKLAHFMTEFSAYLKSIGKEAGIYGHVGSGCMHIRPYIDLRKAEELSLMQEIMERVSGMVLSHGGSMSGEHGDGLIRSWLNKKMFGSDLYQAFKDLKRAFDPDNLMNPHKITDGPPLKENLRISPETPQVPIHSFLDFSKEGGIELAADMCNGNGQCRKKESVMCPSFQVSDDEYHTTRARAQSLRAIIHGKLPIKALKEKALYDVLDLCIECKGCKKECPSQVDMAKMKAELLYQYQEAHGYSLRNRFFGALPAFSRLASPFAAIVNTLTSKRLFKKGLAWIGISPERDLPKLAKERFSIWFQQQKQEAETKKVVLFNDTYTEFYDPQIGQKAYTVLKALGYEVLLISGICCGRPLISKGLLKEAKANVISAIQKLNEMISETTSLIILEPSCASVFTDDAEGLLGNTPDLNKLRSHILSFDQFMHQHLVDGQLPLSFQSKQQNVWVHGHCHQKSLIGMNPTLEVLRGIPGFSVHEIPSGCCGMAGAFGYEKEHYEFSMKIGGLKLFPLVKTLSPDDLIIASGFSCRSQIKDGTSTHAIHLAEAIASQLSLTQDNYSL